MIGSLTRRLLLGRSAAVALAGTVVALPAPAKAASEPERRPDLLENLGCIMLDGKRVWFDVADWDVEHGTPILVIHGSDLKVATASRDEDDRPSDHQWRKAWIDHVSGVYRPGVKERAQVRVIGRVIEG